MMPTSVTVKFKKLSIFQNLNKAEQLAVREERRGAASRVVDTGGCVRMVVVLLRKVLLSMRYRRLRWEGDREYGGGDSLLRRMIVSLNMGSWEDGWG